MARWWQPSPAGELKPIPWLAPLVIEYLNNLIQPDWEIIEHGSGGSTLWFAERAQSVISFESENKWREIVKEKAPENAIILSSSPFGFNHDVVLNKCDLLLIDGEPVAFRREWIKEAVNIVRPGGWIVLDNANRPEYKAEREALGKVAELVERFDNNEGSTQYLVTEFYRLPLPEAERPKPKRRKKAGDG
jgi:predicted O-methyltransferase YrrM